jgi:hypothetical protein
MNALVLPLLLATSTCAQAQQQEPPLVVKKVPLGAVVAIESDLDSARVELVRMLVALQGKVIYQGNQGDTDKQLFGGYLKGYLDGGAVADFDRSISVVTPHHSVTQGKMKNFEISRDVTAAQPTVPEGRLRTILATQLLLLNKLDQLDKRLKEIEARRSR